LLIRDIILPALSAVWAREFVAAGVAWDGSRLREQAVEHLNILTGRSTV
jgi:hypothetical protein